MSRKGWYMFAYDIADQKRLAKVHGVMKQAGIAAQKSVFFVHGSENEVWMLLNKLDKIIQNSEDDIRAYPVTHPGQVWTTGGPLEMFPLSGIKKMSQSQTKKTSQNYFERLLAKVFKSAKKRARGQTLS